jgi:hypothetical protein
MKKPRTFRLAKHLYKVPLLAAALLLAVVALAPIWTPKEVDAAQITNRSVQISSGQPGATSVTYTFTFTLPSTSPVQGLKFVACDNAVSTYPGNTGSCTAPTGFSGAGGGFSGAAFGSMFGTWQGATNFAVDPTGANDCVPSGTNHNILCATRTDATNQTTTSHQISFTGIKNPTANNYAFYIGIYTYSTANYVAPQTDFGATATAVTQALTTNAAVAEILNFCVGSTAIDDVSTVITPDCSTLSGTSVNLGTLDTSTINITPWTTNCTAADCGMNAVAMVRSNAGNGTTVSYDAIQQSGTDHKGTLRISGATCDDPSGTGTPSGGIVGTNDLTDPCINAAGSTQTVLNPGQEKFGMTIAGVNYGSTTSYSCQYTTTPAGGDTCNLKPLSNYLGKGGSGTEDYGTDNGFAWDETGTAVNIASSGTSTIKQIDDEALIIKYAATPQITTPFGPYQAQTDFIAVPVY